MFYSVLTLAWVLGNPVGSAPDEGQHYLKALAVRAGEPAGDRVAQPPSASDTRKEAWVKRTARSVDVPAGLSPTGLDCNAGNARRSAGCQEGVVPPPGPSTRLTTVGTAQPTTYLVPGILARFADNPVTAIQLGRLGSAALSLGMVWVAVALLWDRSLGGLSIVGLVAAVTPMVIFLTSSLTASGPEVAAGVCFFAALLRMTRGSTPPPWLWVGLGVSGVLLAASRTLGPLWVAVDVVVVVAAHGLQRTWHVVRPAGSRAFWASSAVVLAVTLSMGWEIVVQPHGSLDSVALRDTLRLSYGDLHRVLGELVGVFGSLDAVMPAYAYALWWVMLAVLCVAALWVGRWRQRVVMVALAAGIIPLTLGIAALNLAQTGFGMQGRYVLPLAVGLPLLAGEVLVRCPPGQRPVRSEHLSLERLLVPFALVAGGVQTVAWYANARRSAIGTDGSWWFISSSEWAPRTGWYPMLALAALAPAIALVLAVASYRPPGHASGRNEALPCGMEAGSRR